MARITVEDCLPKVEGDRFALVVLAAQRARELALGAHSSLPHDNDKYPVIALREIAESTISNHQLKEAIVKRYQQKQLLHSEDSFEVVDEEAESAYMRGMTNISSPTKKRGSAFDDGDESDDDTGY